MKKQALNGKWLYRVGKGTETEREVPFSALCVGHSECRKIFDLDRTAKKYLLKLEGITYSAKVTLNGEYLGDMLPYCEYVFDVTGAIKPENNELLVELEDISPVFGPTAGWNNYGGIIRDVYLLFAEEAYIEDVFFYTELKNGYKDADYTVKTKLSSETDASVSYTLSYDGETVDSFVLPEGVNEVTRSIEGVSLWSLDTPSLYQLRAALIKDGKEIDSYECNVGFREIKCDRHRFLFNGKPLFLHGVCKHEMLYGYGHTVPAEEIEKDLRRIKETGCNFVRLVHYPHGKATLDIADKLGLMVSEEPGLWWSRTEVPEVSQGSLEVLRRTVLRDRNHPCVAFWLSFNECRFTEQFLIDSARVCRECDPSRMVSGANCMSNEDTLKYYNLCGFDFYTMHPYSETPQRGLDSARILHDKPLLFTEWGGYHVYENPHLLSDFISKFYNLYEQNSDEGALAGAFFWYWREVKDYGRGKPACVDGTLKEALVCADGEPTMIYEAYKNAWKRVQSASSYNDTYYYEPCGAMEKTALGYIGGGSSYAEAFERAKPSDWEKQKFNGMRYRRMTLGPVLQNEETKGIALTPYVVYDGDSISFKGAKNSGALTVLGAVSMSKGYPISGAYGEAAAVVDVGYSDGSKDTFELRNGVEITTVYTSIGSSVIDPVAEMAKPFARFGYERNFENYLMNALTLPLSSDAAVEKITVSSADNGYDVLIYGVYL